MILDFIRNAFTLGRQAKENINAGAAAEAAYAGDAGLEGVILAYTGSTSAAADNLASAAVMERIESLERLAHNSAQVLEDASLELREIAFFLGRLRSEPLRKVLED